MSSQGLGVQLVVVVTIAALFTGFWAMNNRPVPAPDWPEKVSGFSYSPFRHGGSPKQGRYPSEAELREDLAQLSTLTDSIRIYSVDGPQADIPRLAEEFGLRVTLGVWISRDLERNEREIEKAIELANTSPSVVRVVVGNEALYRGDVSFAALVQYLKRVRAAVTVPVTTSEQWHNWREHRELARHVDLIAAHILPYWEFIPVESAGTFVMEQCPGPRAAVPAKATPAVGGRLAEQRPHARRRRSHPDRPGHLPAQPGQHAQPPGLRLLRHRSLRPALEGQ
ncbi:hypothetical protein ACN469_17025 [Corallococcus terminator]